MATAADRDRGRERRQQIVGNYIGTDSSGLETSPNAIGISVDSGSENVIGGSGLQQNVISGNSNSAAAAAGTRSMRRRRRRDGDHGQSRSASPSTGESALGNSGDGIEIASSTNTVTNNTIANNGGTGVVVFDGTGNSISTNSIHDNGGLGIDLAPALTRGVTANDAGDTDTGPNDLQNFPVIDNVTQNGVGGTLTSAPGSTRSRSSRAPRATPSGYGEGATLLQPRRPRPIGAGGTATWGIETPRATAKR